MIKLEQRPQTLAEESGTGVPPVGRALEAGR